MSSHSLTSRQRELLLEAVLMRQEYERTQMKDNAPRVGIKQDLKSMRELLERADEVRITTI